MGSVPLSLGREWHCVGWEAPWSPDEKTLYPTRESVWKACGTEANGIVLLGV